MNKLKYYFWVGVGLLFIGYVIYIRLILERLPKDITFIFNNYSAIFFCWIIFIHLLNAVIIHWIKSIKDMYNLKDGFFSRLSTKISDILEKPFYAILGLYLRWPLGGYFLFYITGFIYMYIDKLFDYFSLQKNIVKELLKYIVNTLPKKIVNWFPNIKINTQRNTIPVHKQVYLIINILPRVIVLICFLIDIYNLHFYYFYKVLGILIIPFFYNFFVSAYITHYKERFVEWSNYIRYPDIFDKNLYTLEVLLLKPLHLAFQYQSNVPEPLRLIKHLEEYYNIYHILLRHIAYKKLAIEDFDIVFINRIISFLFASGWWYILFNMFLYK